MPCVSMRWWTIPPPPMPAQFSPRLALLGRVLPFSRTPSTSRVPWSMSENYRRSLRSRKLHYRLPGGVPFPPGGWAGHGGEYSTNPPKNTQPTSKKIDTHPYRGTLLFTCYLYIQGSDIFVGVFGKFCRRRDCRILQKIHTPKVGPVH